VSLQQGLGLTRLSGAPKWAEAPPSPIADTPTAIALFNTHWKLAESKPTSFQPKHQLATNVTNFIEKGYQRGNGGHW
jgi:hypothetical protein